MSRRLTGFRAATIMPQTTCNYHIVIPSIVRSLIAVESATLPFKKTISSSVYIRGLNYQIPVKQTAQGVWNCTMPENLFMATLYQSLAKWNNDVRGNVGGTNEVLTFQLGKIYIFITDALTGSAPVVLTILDDCYLIEIKDLPLNASGATDVMKVSLSFQYNNIIDPYESAGDIMGVNSGLTDGSWGSTAAMEAGVAAITTAAWSAKNTGTIKDLLL